MPNVIMKEFLKGFWDENPTLRLVLGMCPTLATSTSVLNGLGMGVAATFVLVCSNVVISMLRKAIPDRLRIPCFIVVIAAFVTIVDLVLQGFMPALSKSLGVFVPLIVVNCIILGRAEAYAYKNGVFLSFIDGLGMGLGFTVTLGLLGAVREILGNGTFMNITVTPETFNPAIVMILPPGAFISLGLFVGTMNWITQRQEFTKLQRERLALSAGRANQ
jgi:Na+-translocating ferredoxin:NAD+ oxidoreductase subunit E